MWAVASTVMACISPTVSAVLSSTETPGQNPKTLRAVLNPAKARAISESSLQSAYDAFVKSHPRTRRALGFAKAHSTSDSMSQFALLMGYNVITTKVGYNETYYTVIDRSALIMSKTRV